MFFHDGFAWRAVLTVFYAIVSVTYLVEYGLIPSHGALLLQSMQHPALACWSAAVSTPATLLRLPMFLAMLAVFGRGAAMAARGLRSAPSDR